jgi:hypothetical protein
MRDEGCKKKKRKEKSELIDRRKRKKPTREVLDVWERERERENKTTEYDIITEYDM